MRLVAIVRSLPKISNIGTTRGNAMETLGYIADNGSRERFKERKRERERGCRYFEIIGDFSFALELSSRSLLV